MSSLSNAAFHSKVEAEIEIMLIAIIVSFIFTIEFLKIFLVLLIYPCIYLGKRRRRLLSKAVKSSLNFAQLLQMLVGLVAENWEERLPTTVIVTDKKKSRQKKLFTALILFISKYFRNWPKNKFKNYE